MSFLDRILRLRRGSAPKTTKESPPSGPLASVVASDLTFAAQVVVIDEASGNEVELRIAAQRRPDLPSDVLDLDAFNTLLSAREVRRQKTVEHSSMDDGYALYAGGRCLFEPTCCGSLSDIDNWRAAVEAADDQWRELWIGHPCLIYRRDGADILIQSGFEPGGSPVEPAAGEPIYKLPLPSLSAAVAAASSLADEVAAIDAIGDAGLEKDGR